MTKKTLIIAFGLMVIVAASGFSLGLGLAFGLPFGDSPGDSNVMFSAKLDELPFLLGLSYDLEGTFRLGLTADWWLATGNLTGPINYYLGPGLYGGISGESFDIGLRVPIGLNIYPIPELELFLEVAPALPFFPNFPRPFAQAAAGFRFWF